MPLFRPSLWTSTGVQRGMMLGFTLVSVVSIFVNILVLTSPIYMLQVYDRVVPTGRVETLLYLSLIAFIALATMGVLDALRGRLLVRLGRYLDIALRPTLMSWAISGLGGPASTRRRALEEYAVLRGYFASPAVLPFLDLPWTPFFVLVMALLHPWLGALAAASAALLFALTFFNNHSSRRLVNEAGSLQAAVNEFTFRIIGSTDVVRAMGMQDNIRDLYEHQVSGAAAANQRAAEIGATAAAASRALRIAVQSAALGLGAFLVIRAELTPGGMIAGSILLGRALAPIEQGIGSWRQFLSARGAFRFVKDQLTAAKLEEMPIELPAISGQLSVDIRSYLVPGRTLPVLSDVQFTVDPGTVVGIVGPSASGKSTLCRLLVGADRGSAGVVRIDGADVAALATADRQRGIGYLPQAIELLDGSVAHNIARLGQIEDAAVVAATQWAGCHDKVLHLPQGYGTQIGPNGTFLSGGQQQQIALARALYGSPRMLVLDEPNSNLDQEGEAALLAAIIEAKRRKMVVVVVSHRSTLLSAIDRLLVLKNGTVERFGDRDEILRDIANAARPTLVKSTNGVEARVR